MADDRANTGFLRRWSRRKLTPERPTGATRGQRCAPGMDGNHQTVPDDLAQIDLNALDFSSDFRRFMKSDVPGHVRTRALQALWSSHEAISCPDDLDDYLEDFSEAAMALPAELAKSAYIVGRGFWDGEDGTRQPETDAEEHVTDHLEPMKSSASSEPMKADAPDRGTESKRDE